MTLAAELGAAQVVASDLSLGALRVAAANAARHGVASRVRPLVADLAAALRLERFDLVVSNPPYVNPGEAGDLSPEVVDFEPSAALFAADRGRAVLARLLASAPALRHGTRLVLEIGYDQSEWLREVVACRRELELEDLVRDYGGVLRTAVLRRTI